MKRINTIINILLTLLVIYVLLVCNVGIYIVLFTWVMSFKALITIVGILLCEYFILYGYIKTIKF